MSIFLQASAKFVRFRPRFRSAPSGSGRQQFGQDSRIPRGFPQNRPRFRLDSASVPCGSTIFFANHNAFSFKPRNEVMNGSICFLPTTWGGVTSDSFESCPGPTPQRHMHTVATTCRHGGFAGDTTKPSTSSPTTKT